MDPAAQFDEIGHTRELRLIAKRRLHELRKQRTATGFSAEPKVPLEIEDLEAEIKRLDATLERLGVEPEQDQPMTMALETPRPTEIRATIAAHGVTLAEQGAAIAELRQDQAVHQATVGEQIGALRASQVQIAMDVRLMKQTLYLMAGLLLVALGVLIGLYLR